MAINEACQVWIEQRIEEELHSLPESGKSLRAIGREIADEIERVFLAKVNPETLRKKAERMSGTNVPPQPIHEEHKESGENQSPKLETKAPLQHRAAEEQKGGPQQEAGMTEKENSDALFQLKRWWKKATKKDRRQFILWTDSKAKERGYTY